MKIILKWFRINSLNANPGKLQFIIFVKKNVISEIKNEFNCNQRK